MNAGDVVARVSVGFIGVGHMGSAMTRRLLAAGYPVTVYDRTETNAQAVARDGAMIAGSPKELAQRSRVVMLCVTDDRAQSEVTLGAEGALEGAAPGTIVIDLSTVSPEASQRLHTAAKNRGLSMIDAAVSGSVPQVEEGSLVIFVGGEAETFQSCKRILETLGRATFYMGESGMGTTMKLAVNTLLGLGMQALAEVIAFSEKAGIEKGLMLDVLEQTAVLTPGQKGKLANVRRDEYPKVFALSLMHKDLELVLKQAYDLSVPMPATAAAQQMAAAALAGGMDADFSVMIKFMSGLAKPPRSS